MSVGKWRKGTAVLAACGIVCLLAAVVLLYSNRESGASGLTLEEARSEVLKQYAGEIVSGEARDGGYLLELKTDQGLYEVTVSGKSAELTGIRLVERYADEGASEGSPPAAGSPPPDDGNASSPPPMSTPVASPDLSTPTPSPTEKPTSSIHISEEQAESLALKKVAGKVTDVDKEEDDGVWFYYVDIETDDGREAEVQLNAASGSIVTVAWDDDDYDKNDYDDE